MHMPSHLRALGHEVQGSYYTGSKRKKPENREEVGAVKDHFSEGRQQEKPPRTAPQSKPLEAEALPFDETETGEQDLYEARNARHASSGLAVELALHTIHSLFKEIAPEASSEVKKAAKQPQDQEIEQSLNDLLALMRHT